jgi:hypothetical protein
VPGPGLPKRITGASRPTEANRRSDDLVGGAGAEGDEHSGAGDRRGEMPNDRGRLPRSDGLRAPHPSSPTTGRSTDRWGCSAPIGARSQCRTAKAIPEKPPTRALGARAN